MPGILARKGAFRTPLCQICALDPVRRRLEVLTCQVSVTQNHLQTGPAAQLLQPGKLMALPAHAAPKTALEATPTLIAQGMSGYFLYYSIFWMLS